MGIPELIKSPYALGGLGAAGTGAVGIAGWQYLTSDAEQVSTPVNLLQAREDENGCDILLFGKGQTSGIGYASESTDGATWTDDNVFTQSEPITSSSTGNSLGCISILINANPTSEKNYLSMGLAFKSDNIGWFLRSTMEEGAASSSSNQYALTHNLFLLKKESSDWKVKKGFEWSDSKLKSLNNEDKAKVKIPWQQTETEITIGTNPSGASIFVGAWESSSTGKGILEEVGLYKESNTSDISDILGRTGDALKTENIYAEKVYDTTTSPWKWKTVATSITNKNIKNVVEKWYEPFKDVKGSWTEVNDEYCKTKWKSSNPKIDGLCVKAPARK